MWMALPFVLSIYACWLSHKATTMADNNLTKEQQGLLDVVLPNPPKPRISFDRILDRPDACQNLRDILCIS
jgi:hypothetical protein